MDSPERPLRSCKSTMPNSQLSKLVSRPRPKQTRAQGAMVNVPGRSVIPEDILQDEEVRQGLKETLGRHHLASGIKFFCGINAAFLSSLLSEVFQLEDISTALCQGRARGWPRLDERDGGGRCAG